MSWETALSAEATRRARRAVVKATLWGAAVGFVLGIIVAIEGV